MALDTAIFARMRANVLAAVKEDVEGTMSLAQERVPRDTETLHDSARTAVEGDTVYGSFGRDNDVNPRTGQPSNVYAELVEEDTQKHHPTGQSHFLRSAVDERRAGMLARIAAKAKV